MLEHGAYTLLLDSCYDRERFPSFDDAIEWCWARSEVEIEAVRFVLSKFFTLTDGLYVQNRISEEIEQYHSNSATNKRIAQEREEARRTKRERSVNEPPPNHKPITNNQEILKTKPLCLDDAPSIKNVASSIKTPKGSRLNKEWVLPADWGNWALEQNPAWGNSKVESIADGFRDYWISVAGAKGVKADWEATWRNWIRRQNESYLSSGS